MEAKHKNRPTETGGGMVGYLQGLKKQKWVSRCGEMEDAQPSCQNKYLR